VSEGRLPQPAGTPLRLDRSIVYGPVRSRRLGRSLGINLFPRGHKVCAFDCIYCQYGRTTDLTLEPTPHGVPVESVMSALERALHAHPHLDSITFSGQGEPTLHAAFPALVKRSADLRDRFQPQARLAVLSCSGLVMRPGIRAVLRGLDDRIMKLDAGDEVTFQAINRPAEGLALAAVIEGLASLPGVIIQHMVVEGAANNRHEAAHAAWVAAVRRIGPAAIQIYSIERPTAEHNLRGVPLEALQALAQQVEAETGIATRAF
jgi:wyosine [tRNA(Phe)-imidazoG37] synthetase (radical SAM superfamily)